MARRRWKQIVLRIPEAYQDLLIGQLALLSFDGFLQEEERLVCTIRGNKWNSALSRRLRFVLGRFQREFPEISAAFSTSSVAEQNWNARWERTAGLVDVSDRLVIKPTWKKLRTRDRGKIVLTIDPKMSFGTGHHETTRLCLLLLERHVQKGMTVLDIGTGTGILAIAAVKLGATRASGIDLDRWAVENARENVRRNNVRRKVSIRKGSMDRLPGTKFDLLLSNIDIQTNSKHLSQFVSRLKNGGLLILSGFLTSDAPGLLDALEKRNLIPVEFVVENEWAAFALRSIDENWRH